MLPEGKESERPVNATASNGGNSIKATAAQVSRRAQSVACNRPAVCENATPQRQRMGCAPLRVRGSAYTNAGGKGAKEEITQ